MPALGHLAGGCSDMGERLREALPDNLPSAPATLR